MAIDGPSQSVEVVDDHFWPMDNQPLHFESVEQEQEWHSRAVETNQRLDATMERWKQILARYADVNELSALTDPTKVS